MHRNFFQSLAAAGLRMPIGTHLVLHEHADFADILQDGPRLGEVIVETAQRFGTPLAVPLMDLTLEKEALLLACGVPAAEIDGFHFAAAPQIADEILLTPRMKAACDAIAHVARRDNYLPMGMSIGPFSLMTKLVSDPITPVFMAASGVTADDDPEVALVEQALAAAERVVRVYLDAQIAAGAQAVIICEPAANCVYFSPKQLVESYATFDRLVMEPARRLNRILTDRGVALIFHDCGELTDGMVERFGQLGAAMLSLGSSRKLWEDAALIPDDVVIYGNLPTKQFYASQFTLSDVERVSLDLLQRMRETGHPFILGSECDVLSVTGREAEIAGKVDAFMRCGCRPPTNGIPTCDSVKSETD